MDEKSILQELLKLNFLEINNLILNLEKELNITPGFAFSTNNTSDVEETKDNTKVENILPTVEIILKSIAPDKKISVLKTIKTLLNIGLKETKEIVDNLPKKLKETNDEKEINELKNSIEQAGGVVELKKL